MTLERRMEAYSEMMASVTSALVKALAAGVSAESIAASLDQLKTLLEESE